MTNIKRKIKQKRKSNRDKVNNPGLKLNLQSRLNREYVDYDYLDKLSPEEKKFMSKFTQEHYSGTFQKNPDMLGEEDEYAENYGNYDPETNTGNLVEDKKTRRKMYIKNNDKLNDVYGQVRAFSKFKEFENLNLEITNDDNINNLLDKAFQNPDKVRKFKQKTLSKHQARKQSQQSSKKLPEKK